MGRSLLAFFFFSCLLCANQVAAMDFSFTARMDVNGTSVPTQLSMSGPIMPGDHARLLAQIRERPMEMWFALKDVRLQSPGGDVREAMLLGATLRRLYVHTQAQGDCASACLVLWMSGSWRWWGNGRIGVHRPSFKADYFKSLPLEVAEAKYAELSLSFKAFLIDQGLPLSIYEKLMSMSSQEIHWLSESELLLIGGFPPYYDELLKATCGSALENDEQRSTMRRCDAKLSLRMKAKGFDGLLKDARDPWWEQVRLRFLQ